MKHIVVGLDTGKTSAIACLDLEGRLLFLQHSSEGGIEWFAKLIMQHGIPSIIATDKARANSMLRKVNATFSAILFQPEKDISVGEKRRLARALNIKDRHERDAYAAARAAYNAYANKLKQAAAIAAADSHNADIDMVRAKVIGRYSISEALSDKVANRR